MIPIILLSILSVYLFIERYSYIRKATVIDDRLVKNIMNELKNNRPDEALVHATHNKTALGKILESGLSQKGKTAKEAEGYMESTTNIEIAMMEKDTGYLGIIAGVAPQCSTASSAARAPRWATLPMERRCRRGMTLMLYSPAQAAILHCSPLHASSSSTLLMPELFCSNPFCSAPAPNPKLLLIPYPVITTLRIRNPLLISL